MGRWMSLFVVWGVAACEPGACELAAANQGCPECSDGVVTCSFGGVSATEASCGGCQARAALYQALCDAGSTATADEIEQNTECEPAAKAR